MILKIFNTLTKVKEEFKPLKPGKVGMYVCGPTVYSEPHLGNGLSIVIFDLLYRVLIHLYGKENITYVRNITDVDDKINNAAIKRNLSINELTSEIIGIFQHNANQLNCLLPTIEPKATEHIDEIINLINILVEKNYAYESNNHVYFEVQKYKDYGKIAGRDLDELIVGARIDVSSNKKDAKDFVLWKPADKDTPKSAIFDSPWGKGRPGWHIECSAMSNKYLGDNFDIHGGGVDLVFPHHTNEIAQSCSAYDNSIYAKYWVHNGFLKVNGEKMSKSLGNFITINDLLNKGVDGEVIRYNMMLTHYRKPMDWNDKAVDDAKKALDSFYRVISCLDNKELEQVDIDNEFLAALLDDLNTPNAYAILHHLVSKFNKTDDNLEKKKIAIKLNSSAKLIGLLSNNADNWFKKNTNTAIDVDSLIQKRIRAKKEKNWLVADQIRNQLLENNIILEDKPDGTTIWRKK